MAARTPEAQAKHDDIVIRAARFLAQNGFNDVKAHLPGFIQPSKITWSQTGKGHIPDVSGSNDVLNIFEVETADSIGDQHTADQWKLFAAYATQHNAIFWVTVPKGYADAASQRLASLGLAGSAKIWER